MAPRVLAMIKQVNKAGRAGMVMASGTDSIP
jgi:hypothetical protein